MQNLSSIPHNPTHAFSQASAGQMEGLNGHSPESMQQNGGQGTPGLMVGSAPGVSGGMATSAQQSSRMMLPQQMMPSNGAMQQQNTMGMQSGSGVGGQLNSVGHSPVIQSHMNQGFMQQPVGGDQGGALTPSSAQARMHPQQQMQMQNSGQNYQGMSGYGNQGVIPQMMIVNSGGAHQSGQPSPRHTMMVSNTVPGSMSMSSISPSSMQSVMMMPGGGGMQNSQQPQQQQQQPQQQQSRGQVMNSMQMHNPQHQMQQGYAPNTSSSMHYGQGSSSAVSQGAMQSMHMQNSQQGMQMMQQSQPQPQQQGSMHPGGMGQQQQHAQNFQASSQSYSVGMQGQGYQPQQQPPQQQQQQHAAMHHQQQHNTQGQRLGVGAQGMGQQQQQQTVHRGQFPGQGMPQQLQQQQQQQQQQQAVQHGNMMQHPVQMQGQQSMTRRQQMPGQHMAQQPMQGNPGVQHPQQNLAAMQRQPRQDMFAAPRAQPWHNASADAEIRARIKNEIVTLLRDRRPDGGQAWEDKLPRMAERLELTLYGHAKTREEYADTQKLKQRLQELAQSMHSKHARPMPGRGVVPQQAAAAPTHPGSHMTTRQAMAMQSNAGHQMMAGGQVQAQHAMHQSDPRTQAMIGQQSHSDQQAVFDGAAHTGNAQQRRLVNLEEINPLMSARPTQQPISSTQAIPQGQMAAGHGHMVGAGQQQPQQPGAPGQPVRTQEDQNRREVLKQQQKRLLLLRHASKCPHDGKCPVTEYCSSMKTLWRHIMQCKDQDCKVPHCISSRYVLAHYSRCKEPNCPVCGPVRDAIRKQHQRNQQIMSINQRPGPGGDMTEPVVKRPRIGVEAANGMHVVPGNAMQAESSMVAQQKPRAKRELDPVSCAMYSFSSNQIRAHIANITEGLTINSTKVKQMLLPIIEDILRQPGGYIFAQPVDPVALGLPDYFDIIKTPMDIGTVKKRLETCSYRTPEQVHGDVHLTFNNAMTYNARASDVHSIAKTFKKEWDRKYTATLSDHEKQQEEGRKNNESCSICGHVSLKFEPPVFYCNGRCNGKRIRRNSYYYAATGNQYHWCAQCHQELRDNQAITLPEMTLTKKDLQKKKHDEHQEEPWVQCDLCHRWVHQICGLFNGRRNVSEAVAYLCPNCILDRRAAQGEHAILTKILTAKDLPHTKLSTFIEQRIRERLEEVYSTDVSADNKPIERAPDLFLRQVSSVEKMHTVRSGMFERYKNKNYPSEFPVRVKCLVLFQNIDGQDVVLFGMYVYEYGHKCPQPNQRRVYISYLDSVNYFRPKQYRTTVYHEILVSYLEYVRKRGFHTAHIWACPPLKGDDYILYAHPQDQKTPKDDRLRQWYVGMLEACQQRGIIHEVTDFHTEFLTDPTLDATVLPYFEGDYWVGEAENIIKELSDEENDDDGVVDGSGYKTKSKKRKAKSKTKKSKPAKTAVLKRGERDPVMAKLASIIEPMKEAFFVARLHPKAYAEQTARQRELELEQERSGQSGPPAQTEEALQEEALNSAAAVSDMPPGNMHASAANKRKSARVKIEGTDADTQQAGPVVANHAPFATSSSSNDQRRPASLDADVMRQLKEEPAGDADTQTPTSMPITPGALSGPGRGDMTVDANVFDDERSDELPMETPQTEGSGATDIKIEPGQDGEAQSQQGAVDDSTPAQAGDVGESAVVESAAPAAEDTEQQPQVQQTSVTEAEAAPGDEQPMDVAQQADAAPEAAATTATAATTAATAGSDETAAESKADNDTEDPDDTMDSEFFETRQAFLNLCQGNHYQFDQLRRAKHSSMMVLYHLHNPDAPKFVVNCHKCHAEILAGIRYHCETCGDKDFCHNCFTHKLPMDPHPHPLRPFAVTPGQGAITGADQRERRRKIELHLQLLQHAATCGNAACGSPNCQKMKDFLKHGASCESGVRRGCPLCRRLASLLKLHAESCRRENCEVPRCRELKEQTRQMQLRQQQMDDRRRAMMNEMYRGVAAQRSEDS